MNKKNYMRGGSLLRNLCKKVWYPLTVSKYFDLKYKDSTYLKFVININRRNFNLTNDKNENILPQQVYLAIK